MLTRKLVASAAAISLLAAPAVAQFERSSAPVAGESQLGDGDNATLIWSALAVAAFVGAVILVTDDDDDDEPISV